MGQDATHAHQVEIPTSRVGSDTAGPDPRRVHRVEIPTSRVGSDLQGVPDL